MHSVRNQESAPRNDSSTASDHYDGLHRAPPGSGRRRPSRRRGRPRSRGRTYLIGALVTVGLLGSVVYYQAGARSDTLSATPRPRSTVNITHTPTLKPARTPGPKPTPTSTKIDVPATGPGTFVTARASGSKVGRGAKLLRYTVQVETGIDISAAQAANEIADILAARRGWTRNGVASFQLVGAGEPYDLKVMIATPGTADALCWTGIQQDTHGEYNCEVPGGVVVNLRRWVDGSPTFDGPIHDYRTLIVNHEMGHFLGYTHETCAGPGQLAPVMMQQIKGLFGCKANAWPYDENGHLITGPPAP